MTITIIPNNLKAVLPRDFQVGRVYQAINDPNTLVVGTRKLHMETGQRLVGVGLDPSATPWYDHDKERQFVEVNVTITVSN